MRFKALIVDDDKVNLALLTRYLSEEFDVVQASSGQEALELAAENRPDIIFLDIMMPGMDGYSVKRSLSERGLGGVPVVFSSALDNVLSRNKAEELGAAGYIKKPFMPDIVKETARRLVAGGAPGTLPEGASSSASSSSAPSAVALAERFALLLEKRGVVPEGSMRRGKLLAAALAEGSASLPDDSPLKPPLRNGEAFANAYVLRFVGKAGVSDAILKKANPSEAELAVFRKHPLMGAELLEQAAEIAGGDETLRMAARIARSCTEHWNGEGYPAGLAGEAIPPEGRLAALANIYERLAPSGSESETETAETAIFNANGRVLDPATVRLFRSRRGAMREAMRSFAQGK